MGIKRKFYPSILAGFLGISILAVTPALVVIFLSGLEYSRLLEREYSEETRRQAESIAVIQEHITANAQLVLSSIAALPDVRNGNYEHMNSILKAVHQAHGEYVNFSITDNTGIVRASSLLMPGIDFSKRLHIRNAIDEKRFAAGEYILAAVRGVPSFSFAFPIFNNEGEVTGTITSVLSLELYRPLLERLKIPDQSFMGLVDRNGIRLFYYPERLTNPTGVPIKDTVREKLANIKNNDLYSFVDTASDGSEYIFAARALFLEGETDPYIHIVYATPANLSHSKSSAILVTSLAIVLTVGILALAFSSGFSRMLFGDRLSLIVRGIVHLKNGDTSMRFTTEDSSKDLGQISRALNSLAETLAKRDNERREYTEKLSVSLNEKEVLLKEIHHRVKNNLQIIMSLIRLQNAADDTKRSDNHKKDCATAALAMENRIASMALVHEMLYETENIGTVDICDYTRRILDLIGRTQGNQIDLLPCPEDLCIHVDLDRAVPFGLLINELVTNSFKHIKNREILPRVSVKMNSDENQITLEVHDNGPGLPPGFSMEKSHGLGLQLTASLVQQLSGEIRWENDDGARFIITFPEEQFLCDEA